MDDLSLSERGLEEWRDEVQRQGTLGLARRLLAREHGLKVEIARLSSEARQLELLVAEAYELAGYERKPEGHYGPKDESEQS